MIESPKTARSTSPNRKPRRIPPTAKRPTTTRIATSIIFTCARASRCHMRGGSVSDEGSRGGGIVRGCPAICSRGLAHLVAERANEVGMSFPKNGELRFSQLFHRVANLRRPDMPRHRFILLSHSIRPARIDRERDLLDRHWFDLICYSPERSNR